MDAVQDALEEAVGSVTHERETHEYGTTHPAEDLQHAGVINDTASRAIRHQFSKDGEELANADYIEFTEENVGYISDIFVAQRLRGNGIGTRLREAIIREADVSVLYSYPTNDAIRHIADKQGFQPVTIDGLDGWFVRK